MSELIDLAHEIGVYAICGEGNVSMRRDDNSFLIKASGTNLSNLSEDDLTLCDMLGNKINPSHKKPSIETSFHAWIMKTFPQINFIAHTHPPHTNKILCSSSINDFAEKRLFPDQVVRNGRRSCVVSYACPGEDILKQIKKSVLKFIEKEGYFPKLILLKNHGIIVAASNKNDCVYATLACEKSADIFIGAKMLGGISFLSKKDVSIIDNCPNEFYRRKMFQ